MCPNVRRVRGDDDGRRRFRLPRELPPRPRPLPVDDDAPVVVVLPARDEEAVIGSVLGRLPRRVAGRRVDVVVVDDGSTDATAQVARAHGADVVVQPPTGLGAAVRRALAEASARRPAAVVYLDADDEYPAEHVGPLAEVVLDGDADYVVGTRFGGADREMLPHRTLGNVVLTVLLRAAARRPDLTDGQSGMRAFSPRAAAEAEVVHDYNYAQVLTLDLLAKGFVYAERPIPYARRRTGRSFVRLPTYLRRVGPAVLRELAAPSALRSGAAAPLAPAVVDLRERDVEAARAA